MTRAKFSRSEHGEVIVLLDMNGPVTITNDAEAVVASLGIDPNGPQPRIVYRDAFGMWDGIVVKAGRFDGFQLINGKTLSYAVSVALSRKDWK